MTGRNRREGEDRSVPRTTPIVGEPNDGSSGEEEEQEHATVDRKADEMGIPSNSPNVGDLPADPDDKDDLLDAADDALTGLHAREMRKGGFHSPGDDANPGIDTDVNAPKKEESPARNQGGSRGRSDNR